MAETQRRSADEGRAGRAMDSYSYRVDRRPARVGGGWFLQLLQNGVEVGAQVFPADGSNRDLQRRAYVDALTAAKAWLAAHRTHT